MKNIELIYSDIIEKFVIESNDSVLITKSLEIPLTYYLQTGMQQNIGIQLVRHYLIDVFNGMMPPIQNKQQLFQLDKILPDWFILYDTDKMLIEHHWYLPPELKKSKHWTSNEPDYYFNNRLYAWKILELMKDRIDFKLRPSWERNVFI